jgi:hypothetical protein
MDLDRRAFLKRLGTLLVATSVGPIALDSFGPLGSSA